MEDRRPLLITCAIIGVIVLVLGCLGAVAGGAYLASGTFQETGAAGFDFADLSGAGQEQSIPMPTAEMVRPEDPASGQTTDLAQETLATLQEIIIPINDPIDLGERLLGIADIPETYPDLDAPYELGTRKQFWITNTDTNFSSRQWAVLAYITDHLYFWVGEDVNYDKQDLAQLGEEFENHIYPTTREFFGSEWSPGVDGDPHIYVLYVPDVGFSTAGYFSSSDSLHPLAHEFSNAHELFVINADNTPLYGNYTSGVLAHEFQHMIHWYRDRNETSWINEGFSEVATLLNGYDPGGFDYLFVGNPDYQLNNWPNDGNTSANYGASFLFLAYFLDRLGNEATQMLVAHPENGFKGIDAVLSELAIADPMTGEPITSNDLVLDWALTNFILDKRVGDGRYFYNNYPSAPQAFETETVFDCDGTPMVRDVNQFGTDYIRLVCDGTQTLKFTGSIQTKLLPEKAYSGDYAFWSNKGDESNMRLTQTFDFSEVDGPITFSYYTWYDIEADYDYIYLSASINGKDWEIITTPSGTAEDPSGNSYGWGYNALSGGGPEWIQEEVDLSAYAGQEVQLRFEYVTDAAVHGEGLLLDDMSIPAIGYFSDFEADDGGWLGEGFVRVANLLPQTFELALVKYSDEIEVEYLNLSPENEAEVTLDFDGEMNEAVLVVVGSTRFTRQLAAYEIAVGP